MSTHPGCSPGYDHGGEDLFSTPRQLLRKHFGGGGTSTPPEDNFSFSFTFFQVYMKNDHVSNEANENIAKGFEHPNSRFNKNLSGNHFELADILRYMLQNEWFERNFIVTSECDRTIINDVIKVSSI